MAYKFQLDPAIMSGSLVQEGATEVIGNLTSTAAISGSGLGSFGSINVDGNLTVSSAGAIAGATSIDATGDLTVGSITNAEFTVDAAGNTDIDGTLNVQGVPTFQAGGVFLAGITTANAIAGGTTISGSGLGSFGGGLDIGQGSFTVSTAGAVAGATTISGSGALTALSLEAYGLNAKSAGISLAGAVSGVTTYSALGAHVTSGSITQSGAGAVRFEGILQVTGATTLKSTLSAQATTLSSAKISDLTNNRLVIAGTAGELEDNAKLTFDGADLALGVGTRIIAVDYSGSGLHTFGAESSAVFDGAIALSGASDTPVAVAADSVYFLDATTGKVRRDTFADLASAMAGGGLTAVAGVLSTQGGAVSGGMDGGTATEGYNYFTGTVNAAIKLPSGPSNGDVVTIKAGNTTAGQNITVNCQGSHKIDQGATNIHLESPYAAITLVYVRANDWRLV